MTAKPIIMHETSVRGLLASRKTQTRRVINPQPTQRPSQIAPAKFEWYAKRGRGAFSGAPADRLAEALALCGGLPYAVGDRLWVRETVRASEKPDGADGVHYLADDEWRLIANSQEASDRWVDLYGYRGKRGANVPPIHMPRWASRLTLTVTEVRVERLNDISEEDAKAEGVELAVFPDWPVTTFRGAYRGLWESLHGAGAWALNPWVAVIGFEVERRNIDGATP